MRIVGILCVILILSVPTEATLRAVYDLVTNPIFGTVDVLSKLLEDVLRAFGGFPLIGLVANEGAKVVNSTGSLALTILHGTNRLVLPIVNGLDVIVELPFHTILLTPLRWLLEDTIHVIASVENNTYTAMERMTRFFDGSFNETHGTIIGIGKEDPNIVPNDESVLELVRLLNATVYSTMRTILVPSTTGGVQDVSQRGDRLLTSASRNTTAAISSLNEIQSRLPEGSDAAFGASSALISALNNLRFSLDVNSDSDVIASSVAAVIYKSVRVLVEFSAVNVSKDDLNGFYVNIIGAVANTVNGETLKLASGDAYSTSSISTFTSAALAPLGITVTVTADEIISSQEEN